MKSKVILIADDEPLIRKLVKSLLNLSLIDLGSAELEISVFNISELIEELINKFLPIFYECRI